MLIEQLDRTQWSITQALTHVVEQLVAHVEHDQELVEKIIKSSAPWMKPKDIRDALMNNAKEELLIALRDGDLHAIGRLSTTRKAPWESINSGWALHSGYHSSIAPEQWRSGNFDGSNALTMPDGHFLDIRVPRFATLAIWPIHSPPPTAGAEPGSYRTPYLDLLNLAISKWRITADSQPKKDNLVDWFLQQTIEGEPVSENLASAMATLVRLPASQRGGARRAGG